MRAYPSLRLKRDNLSSLYPGDKIVLYDDKSRETFLVLK